MPAPILDGAPGFVLLTLSVGLGAYIRQVYVAATETYDQVNGGEAETLWPLDAPYTKDRLANLLLVQSRLRSVTNAMFVFIAASSFRMLFSALNAITRIAQDEFLVWYDLFLVTYITGAFLVMWKTHRDGSRKEHAYQIAMREAFHEKRLEKEIRAKIKKENGPSEATKRE